MRIRAALAAISLTVAGLGVVAPRSATAAPTAEFAYTGGYLVNFATGEIVQVGGVAASRDGRYVFSSNGDRLDRLTNTTYRHPDLAAIVDAHRVKGLSPIHVAAFGEVFGFSMAETFNTYSSVVVNVATNTITTNGYAIDGFSPNGQRSFLGGQVADDGSSVVRLDNARARVVGPAGTTVADVGPFGEDGLLSPLGGRQGRPMVVASSDDFRIGLMFDGVTMAVDTWTGARLALEPTRPTSRGWVLDSKGDTAVRLEWACTVGTPAQCAYQPIFERNLRARLALPAYKLGRLAAGGTGSLRLGGLPGVPYGSHAAMVNVTVTNPSADGYLTVWPCDEPRPTASNANFERGQTIAAAVAAPLDLNGAACFYSSAATDVIVDLLGRLTIDYKPTPPASSTPAASVRVLDTRDRGGRVSGTVRVALPTIDVAVMNVTATDASSAGYVTVWPCDQTRPSASNLNITPGISIANLVMAVPGESGELCLFASSPLHLIIDVDGAFPSDPHTIGRPEGEHRFRSGSLRLLDSRAAGSTRPQLSAGTTTVVKIAAADGLPVEPGELAILNVTATNAIDAGYLTVYPCDQPRPTSSNVNFVPGQTIANSAFVAVDAAGTVCMFNSGATDAIVDIGGVQAGYQQYNYIPPFIPVTPRRVADTR
jgi:hypothetical protein